MGKACAEEQNVERAASPKPIPTTRLYYNDTYQFEGNAEVLSVFECEDSDNGDGSKQWIVLLNQTLFHPQGGGQPSDTGTITKDDAVFRVTHVRISKDRHGVVEHLGTFANPNSTLCAGDEVSLAVDADKRRRHASRLHSAGHLLDAAMHSAGHLLDAAMQAIGRTDLDTRLHLHCARATEYIGAIPAEERAAVVARLNEAVSTLVSKNTDVSMRIYDVEGSELPRRVVSVGGCECACGGTHVNNTSQLQGLRVTRIKKNKKAAKVYYELDEQAASNDAEGKKTHATQTTQDEHPPQAHAQSQETQETQEARAEV
ncbi:hypothetical protein PTSG_03194 [Salpingoeca rosetta]|uniref:Alanyl-transfer RNA synthetases family profile domain-containing protein n=1 Tax=Salpingoeca rosetta (strain ATCC 50818 / BSB-021) TaxID=946362 RepID=F2U4H6_SALR5|nr:uncharacterized protein PTSG_03194 [Salpingoeca rosetta]EGD82542.1 hypothetical protein PTSG_03194 [Salpingoeca rosetta]|eukprot:XP_004995778.1 hypothetical protein PTSG_03194 [Salpingoeca rosetta]